MPRAIDRLKHRFVKFIPDELEDGVLYVSLEYKTVTHWCCSGCGEKVVTPLSPAGWELTFNGQSVSLSPSIGGGSCNSHYFIRQGRVQWARPLTQDAGGGGVASGPGRGRAAIRRASGLLTATSRMRRHGLRVGGSACCAVCVVTGRATSAIR